MKPRSTNSWTDSHVQSMVTGLAWIHEDADTQGSGEKLFSMNLKFDCSTLALNFQIWINRSFLMKRSNQPDPKQSSLTCESLDRSTTHFLPLSFSLLNI